MMRDRENHAVSNLANALSPIAQVLLQKQIGIGAFVLAVKLAYLCAAIRALPPRARPNISRLSVVTGMTRKEVALLLRYRENAVDVRPPSMSREQRALKVIRGWESDPIFRTRNGQPAQLDIRRGSPNFVALVRAYGGDVTPAAVLKELERTSAVTRNRSGKLVLRKAKPAAERAATNRLGEFTQLLHDFIEAASCVVKTGPAHPFMGFRDLLLADDGQAALFQRTFSRRASALLSGVKEWQGRQLDAQLQRKLRHDPSAKRVGVGVYVVQSKPALEDKAKLIRGE
jgi:hypothetical protein